MLNLKGTRKTLCDGLTRRDILHLGGIGVWGLTLANCSQLRAVPTDQLPSFGKAKRCIFVFLFGAAPQHETFDPKPESPKEIQGEMREIPTSLPGVVYGEGLPRLARLADRMLTIRSMTHPYPLHSVAYAISGMPTYSTDLEGRPHDAAHWPYLGSVADWYWNNESGGRPLRNPLQHVGLPWVFNSQADDYGLLAGPYAAFLGRQYEPVWGHFTGVGEKVAPKCRHEQPKEYVDPYAACSRNGRFVFHGANPRDGALSDSRFAFRQSLLNQYDEARRQIDAAANVRDFSGQQALALSILTSPTLRQALDISQEPDSIRANYGYTLFGQSCLAARRLMEHGSRFVSVFWDAYGTYFSGGWDTHQNHYPRLREYLLPGFDAGFSALIEELDSRGLLEDTLVICTTEHGRTPQIDSKPAGAARHHWSRAYSTVMAGGGVPRGAVVGKTDRQGGDVMDVPISPKDLQATAFHLLGIPAGTQMFDRQNRPSPIAGAGTVRDELLS